MLNEEGKQAICQTLKERGFALKEIDVWVKENAGGFRATLCKAEEPVAAFFAEGDELAVNSSFRDIISGPFLAEFEEDVAALSRKYFNEAKRDEKVRIVMACLLNADDDFEVERVTKTGEILALMPNGLEWAYEVSPRTTRARLTAKLVAEGAIRIIGGEFGEEL